MPDAIQEASQNTRVEKTNTIAEVSLSLNVSPHMSHVLVREAASKAEFDFKGVYRKSGSDEIQKVPYFDHLARVARRVAIEGGAPEVIAAAYLHDHIEDLPQTASKASLAKQFGRKVSELVDWVTEQDKSLAWAERKELYQERLKKAPAEARLISAADKLCNLQDFVAELKAGCRPEDISKVGWKDNSDRYWQLYDIYLVDVPHSLLEDYKNILQDFDRLGGGI